MQKITPFLWFESTAEEAARFYVSVFKKARLGAITRYGDQGPGAPGTVMTVAFALDGQEFISLNGGPQFTMTPAISFVVNCDTQEEVDHYWDRLSEGGKQAQCGWLTDRYGVTWQIVPTLLPRLLSDPDPAKTQRVMAAMLKMVKLDITALQKAYDGG